MLYRLLLIIFTLSFILPFYCIAEHHRILQNDAIITLPSSTIKENTINRASIQRINRKSFTSLTYDKLSNKAYKIALKRKLKNKPIPKFERFLKSHNPCNAAVIKRLLRTSRNLICEPNWEVKTIATPNDTLQSLVYAADNTSAGRLRLQPSWDITTGSSNVFVGVIDTGVDYTHPDLTANLWNNPLEIASNGIDDDQNGYIDDIYGIDTFNNDSNPLDDQSHGTYVSGILGAVGNNSRGLAGVAWNVKIISCKAFNSAGSGSISAVISCLTYIKNLKDSYGINIVATNNSYGGFPYSQSMYNAIAATKTADIVYVAGAGNYATNNDTTPFYPANYDLDNIISVGATDSDANITSFSNFGLAVDISAPGIGVLTTLRNNQYGYVQGTSMSTPYVTGVVVLIKSLNPSYVYSQVVNSIINTGTIISGLSGKNRTSSILNAENALLYSAPTPTATPINTSTPSPTLVPTQTPESPAPTPIFAKIQIKAVNSRLSSIVTCTISTLINNQYKVLKGANIKLVLKGIKKQRNLKSNSKGIVKFLVNSPKSSSIQALCQSSVRDPIENKPLLVKSKSVRLTSTKR